MGIIIETNTEHDQFMELEVKVISYTYQEPMHNADNPDDYYGFVELDYEVESYTVYDDDGDISLQGKGEPNFEYNITEDEIKEELIDILNEEYAEDYADAILEHMRN